MNWMDALGMGLGLLSVTVNVAVFYLIHRAIARWWCMIVLIIGGIFGHEPDGYRHEGW